MPSASYLFLLVEGLKYFELPKCDSETWSEHMLLEKGHAWIYLIQGYHTASIWKTPVFAKCNKAQYTRMCSHSNLCKNQSDF